MRRFWLTITASLFLAVTQNASSSEGDFSFDIDGDGETEALTDGLLVLRYFFGFSGPTLSEGAVSSSALRADAGDIEAYLRANVAELDVDGNGETDALTDGLLLLRYLFGFRDETLIAGALSSSAVRTSPSDIETYTAERIVETASIFGIDRRPNFAGVIVPTDSTDPGNINVAEAFSGLTFDLPVFLAAIPDEDRLVVVEQEGRVYVFENDPEVATKKAVFDLSDVVLFEGGYDEQGLLGFAFDPKFSTNRYVYVHYSAANPRRSVISRFRWDAATDRIALETEKQLLWVAPPPANHNGGMLAFGPLDGYLYLAFGDGGSGGDPDGNGQNGMTLLGTILRIDVHPQDPDDAYDIPLDNPFRNNDGIRDEIYAMGLRNPWRFSFDRQTGHLWTGDVGRIGSKRSISLRLVVIMDGARLKEPSVTRDAPHRHRTRILFRQFTNTAAPRGLRLPVDTFIEARSCPRYSARTYTEISFRDRFGVLATVGRACFSMRISRRPANSHPSAKGTMGSCFCLREVARYTVWRNHRAPCRCRPSCR